MKIDGFYAPNYFGVQIIRGGSGYLQMGKGKLVLTDFSWIDRQNKGNGTARESPVPFVPKPTLIDFL